MPAKVKKIDRKTYFCHLAGVMEKSLPIVLLVSKFLLLLSIEMVFFVFIMNNAGYQQNIMNRKVFFSVILFLTFFPNCGDSGKPSESEMMALDRKSFSFDEKETTGNIVVTSNAKWTLTCGEATWLTCTPSSGEGNSSVRAVASANGLPNIRTGVITFTTARGVTKTVEVTQTGLEPFISIKPANASAAPIGEVITIDVTASGQWMAQIPDAAKSWISVNILSETQQAILTVAPNQSEEDRSTNLTFKLNEYDRQASFTLSQRCILEGIAIDPEKASVEFGAKDVTVKVMANKLWKVSIPAADTWVKEKDKTTSQVVFSVEANTSGKTRISNIAFQQENGVTVATFVLTQLANDGYTLMATFDPDASHVGLTYSQLHNNLFRPAGFDYSEHPHCTGIGGHMDGVHLAVERDATLNKYVFRFDIHITPVIDSDRCGTYDRQRNEMKSRTDAAWAKVNGNWDEWQRLEWKFKIPVGFQPTSSFCHIHQLKGQEGNNIGAPVITITPRANSNGSNKRMQIIHSVDGANPGAGIPAGLGTVVDNIPLADFEGEWVQVVQEVHYLYNGYYSCVITRIRDNKVLLTYKNENINMWRSGATNIRNKWGIYRSLAGGDLTKNPVGQSALLKNESVWMCDFKVYEKNSNPNPTPH